MSVTLQERPSINININIETHQSEVKTGRDRENPRQCRGGNQIKVQADFI